MTWTDDDLTGIAIQALAGKYGAVFAEFAPLGDLKLTWKRSAVSIRLCISDYLDEAPQEIIADIIKAVQARIEGRARRYEEDTRAWLLGHIAGDKGAVYMERRGLHAGERIDLEAIRPEGCTAALRFGLSNRGSAYSLLFDVIVISEELDREGCEEEIAALIAEEMKNLAEARASF